MYSRITSVLDLEFTDDNTTFPPRTCTCRAQASKFVQDTTDSDIEDGHIILKKEAFGVPGTTYGVMQEYDVSNQGVGDFVWCYRQGHD